MTGSDEKDNLVVIGGVEIFEPHQKIPSHDSLEKTVLDSKEELKAEWGRRRGRWEEDRVVWKKTL